LQWMFTRVAALEPMDHDPQRFEINVFDSKHSDLAGSQTVAVSKQKDCCESDAAGPAKYFLSSMHKETIPLGGRDQSTDRYAVFKAIVSKKRFGLFIAPL
jgi:hypothetical protein